MNVGEGIFWVKEDPHLYLYAISININTYIILMQYNTLRIIRDMKHVIALTLIFFSTLSWADIKDNPYLETILYVADQQQFPASLLLAMAEVESRFQNVDAYAGGTAGGLYQFTDTTWEHLMDRYGEQYPVYQDATKYSPYSASLMACAYMRENEYRLTKLIDHTPSAGDLYLAHLLGASGASWLINAPDNTLAREVIPYAYPRNKRLFINPDGSDRTTAEFRQAITFKFMQLVDKYESMQLSLSMVPIKHAI